MAEILAICDCGATLKLLPRHLGKRVRCSTCQGIVQAPPPDPVPAATVPPNPWTPPAPPAPKPAVSPLSWIPAVLSGLSIVVGVAWFGAAAAHWGARSGGVTSGWLGGMGLMTLVGIVLHVAFLLRHELARLAIVVLSIIGLVIGVLFMVAGVAGGVPMAMAGPMAFAMLATQLLVIWVYSGSPGRDYVAGGPPKGKAAAALLAGACGLALIAGGVRYATASSGSELMDGVQKLAEAQKLMLRSGRVMDESTAATVDALLDEGERAVAKVGADRRADLEGSFMSLRWARHRKRALAPSDAAALADRTRLAVDDLRREAASRTGSLRGSLDGRIRELESELQRHDDAVAKRTPAGR